MKVLEIKDSKLTLEYQDGSIGCVESKEHALLVVRALNYLEKDTAFTSRESENVRIAVMIAFKDLSSLEVYAASDELGVVASRQKYQQQMTDDIVSKIASASHEGDKSRTIYLIRGVGGSGKTTYAKILQKRLKMRVLIETDIIKGKLFDDYWLVGGGIAPEPRQLHREASVICRRVVDELCERGVSFMLVQRFEKIDDAKRIVSISKEYNYTWNIYSITPDFVDITRNNITRSRSLYNINTFSPESLQKSITRYFATASYFYRLATHSFVRSICDIRQQSHGKFSETFYKKDGENIYINRNPSIHVPLLSSRESSQIEEYAIFRDVDMDRYQDFFYRAARYEKNIKNCARRCITAISRTTHGCISTGNKNSDISQLLRETHALRNQEKFLDEVVAYIYNKKYIRIETKDDLRNFILTIAQRVSGLDDSSLFRSHETGKYIHVNDVSAHFDEFLSQLLYKMQHERNRVYVAAYILWNIDFTGHYFSDGCSRISTLLALWYLMRTGHEMPSIARRLDKENSLRSSYRKRHHISRDDIYDEAANGRRFTRFYRYYKSLFAKPSRPVIPCAGGYIFNEKGEVLLLRSAKGKDIGKYVVPGGKMNQGENPSDCFMRETLEETGLSIRNVAQIGMRRYVGPSGRRYLMHDLVAQADNVSIRINNESVSYEWLQPIYIDPKECTASTLDSLNSYLYLREISDAMSESHKERFCTPEATEHATGLLEKQYIDKKLKKYGSSPHKNLGLILSFGFLFSSNVSVE